MVFSIYYNNYKVYLYHYEWSIIMSFPQKSVYKVTNDSRATTTKLRPDIASSNFACLCFL